MSSSTDGEAQTSSASGTLAQGESQAFAPIAIVSGTVFSVAMSGTGDADLYVRFGAAPTATEYACRPFLQGSNESCELVVPAGETEAHVMVHGYTASSFELDVSWTGPVP